jgi:plasmid maintenance system antidote protein VapI
MKPAHRTSIHPGEILWEEFLHPLWPDASKHWIATEEAARVQFKYGFLSPLSDKNRWLNIKLYDLTVLDAIIFSDRFGTSEQFWLTLASNYLKTRHKLGV